MMASSFVLCIIHGQYFSVKMPNGCLLNLSTLSSVYRGRMRLKKLRVLYVCESNLLQPGYTNVLPLFGNDTARQLNIDFTPFFRQIGQFFHFRNEIYKTWGFQKSQKCLKHVYLLPSAQKNSKFWIDNGMIWPIFVQFWLLCCFQFLVVRNPIHMEKALYASRWQISWIFIW